jgi:hypothetical protein
MVGLKLPGGIESRKMADRLMRMSSMICALQRIPPVFFLGLLLISAAACGGSREADSDEAAAAATQAEFEQHLADLQLQIESLARQSEAMRREVLSRLDQIDVTREALEIQLANIKTQPPAAGSEAAEPRAEKSAPVPAGGDAPAEAPPPEDDRANPFLRFLLLVFIVAAMLLLVRVFFERWGDPEDGERPTPTEATTDLGKIRFPPGTEAHPDEGDDADAGADDSGRTGD